MTLPLLQPFRDGIPGMLHRVGTFCRLLTNPEAFEAAQRAVLDHVTEDSITFLRFHVPPTSIGAFEDWLGRLDPMQQPFFVQIVLNGFCSPSHESFTVNFDEEAFQQFITAMPTTPSEMASYLQDRLDRVHDDLIDKMGSEKRLQPSLAVSPPAPIVEQSFSPSWVAGVSLVAVACTSLAAGVVFSETIREFFRNIFNRK